MIADSGFEVSTFVLDKFTLLTGNFTNNNVATGTFGIARGDTVLGGDSSQIYLTYVAVPEPTTIAILGAGVALVGLRLARRRKA